MEMRNREWKQLLSLMMVLAMLLSLFPAALAEDTDIGAEDTVYTDGVWEELLEDGSSEEEPEELDLFLEEDAVIEIPYELDAAEGETEEALSDEAGEPVDALQEGSSESFLEQNPENAGPLPESDEGGEADPAADGDEDAEPAEAPADGESEEAPEGTEAPTEGEEAAEETEEENSEADSEENAGESEEESEKKELPYGFAGMPEAYELSAEELAAKAALVENGVLSALQSGEYVEGEVLFHGASQEYAELVAEAYSAELAYFNGHFGKLILTDATVAEAVEAAADMELPLPAVEPNWIVTEPVLPASGAGAYSAQALFEQQTWQSWMDGTDEPDEALTDPTNPMGGYQYQHDMVNTYETWAVTTGAGVVVAVVDSGVDYTHPDLLGKVLPGYDFVDYDGDPMDENGHGTHVAGIVAATMGNGAYGAGIAPDATILPVRVLDANGSGQNDWIINGVYAAADSGAKIINMSLGGVWYSYEIEQAINYAYSKGATVIVSSGNNGSNIKTWPAGCSHAVTVAAVDAGGGLASYSNYGPWCDVAAPGSDIWSLNPGGDYVCWDGTSMAAPVVSGVAALYMSVYGYTSPDMMKALLKKAVNKGPSGAGTGIIDAAKLFTGDTTPPVIRLFEADGTDVTESGRVSRQGYLLVQSGRGVTTPNSALVFTTDGKNPAVKNGQITSGGWVASEYLFDEGLGGFCYYMAGFLTGDSLTFKVLEVNGLAVPSKVATAKIEIVDPPVDRMDYTELEILAPLNILKGNQATLTAKVYGHYEDSYGQTYRSELENPGVVWTVTSPSGSDSLIGSSTGVLKIPSNFSYDEVTVKARSEAYDAEAEWTVYIDVPVMVKSVKFTGKIPALYASDTYRPDPGALVVTGVDGSVIPAEDVSFSWTSSNPKVATVEGYSWGTPYIFTVGKGSAVITGRATDGSEKTVALKVSVKPSVKQIVITGPSVIAPGTSASLKAETYPKDGANKKLFWYLDGAYPDVTVDANSGKVTVAGNAATGGTVYTVYARPQEGPEAECEGFEFTVSPKASRVDLLVDGSAAPKTLTLFSADLQTTGGTDNRAWLEARRVYSGGYDDMVSCVSSKPDVAEVVWDDTESSWMILAKKAGAAKITATAMDGSNKKAVLSVKVVNPVSNFIIRSKSPVSFSNNENLDFYMVGIGKSVGNSVIFGDTFGKPSNTKVVWDYETHHVGFGSRMEMYDYGLLGDAYGHVNCITVKNGTLSVKKTFQGTWDSYTYYDSYYEINHEVAVKLTATATDGSGAYAEVWYIVTVAATKATMYDNYYVYDDSGTREYYFSKTKNTMTLTLNSSTGDAGVWYNGWWSGFTATSSNPDVAGAVVSGNAVTVIPGTKTGTAKITVKTTDGSNKSVSFNVKVLPEPPAKPTRITVQPRDVSAKEGWTATFSVSAEGSRLSYQWEMLPVGESQWTSATFNGYATSDLSVPADRVYDGWQFRCVVSGRDGMTLTSAPATLSVVEIPELTLGDSVVQIMTAGERARLRFIPTESGTYTLTSTGSEDTYGYLYDAEGNQLTYNDDGGDGGNFLITWDMTAGAVYYYEVRFYYEDMTGSIPLHLSVLPVQPTQDIALGDTVAHITLEGERASYRFIPPISGSYTLTSLGSSDTYGYLYDADHSLLTESDDDGEDGNFLISWDMTAGVEYFYEVRFYYTSTTGDIPLLLSADFQDAEITSHPSSVTARPNETVTFRVTATGTNLSYQWQEKVSGGSAWENTTLNGYRTATLSFTATEADSGNQYRCVVTGSDGIPVYSDPATLFVSSGTTRYRALLIGESDYEGDDSDLPGCANDVRAMQGMLTGLTNGFAVTMKENRSASQIVSDISSAFGGATEDDVSLFYYSGHGASSSDTSYVGALCGTDGSYLKTGELATALSAVKGKVIVIMDSCFSGASITTMGVGEQKKPDLNAISQQIVDVFAMLDPGLEGGEVSPMAGELRKSKFLVLTASSAYETSLEIWGSGYRGGLFTIRMMDGLGCDHGSNGAYTGGSMPADNGDLLVTLGEIYSYTYSAVKAYSNDQTVQSYGNSGEILFRRN